MAIGRIPEPLAGIQESILDAKGDLVTATAADTPARLAVGTNNQTLVADSTQSTGLKYANGSIATLTAKGDLLTATAANTIARLGVGANGTTLVADSAEATGLKWAAAAGGKILQVVSSSTTTPQSLSVGTSFVDGGLSLAITPSATTSKILIMVRQPTYTAQARNACVIKSNIMRGATQIAYTEFQTRLWIPSTNNASELGYNFTDHYLDSPSTTSSTTYKVQYKSDSSFTLELQYQNSTSQIILMEVGA